MSLARSIAPALMMASSVTQAFADTAILTVNRNQSIDIAEITVPNQETCVEIARAAADAWGRTATVSCMLHGGRIAESFVCEREFEDRPSATCVSTTLKP